MGRRWGRWHRDRDGIRRNFRQKKGSGKKEGVKNDSASARHGGGESQKLGLRVALRRDPVAGAPEVKRNGCGGLVAVLPSESVIWNDWDNKSEGTL